MSKIGQIHIIQELVTIILMNIYYVDQMVERVLTKNYKIMIMYLKLIQKKMAQKLFIIK